MIEESKDLNEYAFALGALAHYAADNSGHPTATNPAVAMTYPQLAKKYGPVVTYEDKPSAHMKVEFGFDVDQVAKGHYAPKAYHDFIGFEVSKALLERAFARTYSLDMSSVFFRVDLAIGSYRHAVSTVIPRTTKVAWHLKRREIQHGDPSETKTKFVYNISNSGYRKEWGDVYEKPDFFARFDAIPERAVPDRTGQDLILAESFFDEERLATMKLRPTLRIDKPVLKSMIGNYWSNIVRKPVIPYSQADRKQELADAYRELEEFLV